MKSCTKRLRGNVDEPVGYIAIQRPRYVAEEYGLTCGEFVVLSGSLDTSGRSWPPRNSFDGSATAIETAAMTSRISHTSVDARDAYAQSIFWSEVLDFTEDPDDPNEPGDGECLIMSRDRSQLLLFITVPEG